jgi:hypothetical protein
MECIEVNKDKVVHICSFAPESRIQKELETEEHELIMVIPADEEEAE